MNNVPAEVVFPAASSSALPLVISWDKGPIQIKERSKRGRPPKPEDDATQQDGHITGPGSRFQFVDHAEVSSSARQVIRRHAMIDYVRRKKMKKLDQENEGRNLHLQPHLQDLCPVLWGISAVDPFNAFPIKLEPYMYDLLSFYITSVYETLYSIEKYTGYNPLTAHWIPLAFCDAALLHAILACADSFITECWTPRERPNTVKHLNAAIRITSDRIAAYPHAVSDATMVVVSSVAIMEETTGCHNNWKIHMKGLKKMVEARGGLSALKSEPLLLSKIYLADLCGAVDAAEMPYFRSDENFAPFPRPPVISFQSSRFKDLECNVCFDVDIQCIIARLEEDIISLNLLHGGQTGIDAFGLRTSLTSIQYALLSMRCASRPNELCRMGLVLFMSTILNELPSGRLFGSDNLRMRIKTLLEENSSSTHEAPTVVIDFGLWVMFLAAYTVADNNSELKRWYLSSIVATTSLPHMNGDDWAALKPRVASFFWVPNVHEHVFQKTWKEAQEQFMYPQG